MDPDSDAPSPAAHSSSPSSDANRQASSIPTILELRTLGVGAELILQHLAPCLQLPSGLSENAIWRIIANLVEPPKRKKLPQYNKIEDVVDLIRKCNKIMVLSGAGVSTSAGIPDFRSRNGIYVQIHAEHPDLHDPKSMFDIDFFKDNPRPFFQFAKALYPGQFEPTVGHKFIKCIEDQQKLIRNYTQNIDTLEKQAGIERVVECHGSFAQASCTSCGYTVDCTVIKEDIMNRTVPRCPRCHASDEGPKDGFGVMKPNIVFFGEQLGDQFHRCLDTDKSEVDLLIVIGSSLKVKPVALLPRSIPSKVPQILINREPLSHMEFDVELLGDCDDIIKELCRRLGEGWTHLCGPSLKAYQELTLDLTPFFKIYPEPGERDPAQSEPNSSKVNKKSDKKTSEKVDQTPRSSGSGSSSNKFNPKVSERNASADKSAEKVDPDQKDSDDSDQWEDIEANYAAIRATKRYLQERADLEIPPSSYIYIRPNIYLFRGAELTRAQLKGYVKAMRG